MVRVAALPYEDPDLSAPESLQDLERTEFEKRVGETYGLSVRDER